MDKQSLHRPFRFRPAEPDDAPAIRSIILSAQINPTGLDWRRFLLAVSADDEIIGCGQVKPHGDGTQELASIAVVPEWRGEGVARAIIERLIAEHPGPLYLTCRASLEPFYEKFGFRSLQPEEMPRYFRRLFRLTDALGTLRLMREELRVMERGKEGG